MNSHTRNALPPQGSVSTVPPHPHRKNRPKLYLFFLKLIYIRFYILHNVLHGQLNLELLHRLTLLQLLQDFP